MSETEYVIETRRWLKYAREDLHTAQVIISEPTIAYRHVCWLAQQCAEKAIKAILIYLQIELPSHPRFGRPARSHSRRLVSQNKIP